MAHSAEGVAGYAPVVYELVFCYFSLFHSSPERLVADHASKSPFENDIQAKGLPDNVHFLF